MRKATKKKVPLEAALMRREIAQLAVNNVPVLSIPKHVGAADFLLLLEKRVGRPLVAPEGTGPSVVAAMVDLRVSMEREAPRVAEHFTKADTLERNRLKRHELDTDELAIIATVIRRYPKHGLKALCRKCVQAGMRKGRIGPERMAEIRAQSAWPKLPSASDS